MLKRGVAFLTLIVLAVIVLGVAGYVGMFGAPFLSPSDDSDFAESVADGGDAPGFEGPSFQRNTPQCTPIQEVLRFGNQFNKLNLGETLDEVGPVEVTKNHFPITLADRIYIADDNDEFPYVQTIKIVDAPQEQRLKLTHFRDYDYEMLVGLPERSPTIGIRVLPVNKMFDYSLRFETPAESDLISGQMDDFEGSNIDIMGEEYFILDARLDNNRPRFKLIRISNNDEIELIDNEVVKVNGNVVNGSLASFSWMVYTQPDRIEISEIKLIWNSNEELFIAPLSSPKMGGIENPEFSFSRFVTPDREIPFGVGEDGATPTSIRLKGVSIIDVFADINLLYTDGSGVFTGIGKYNDKRLATSQTNTLLFIDRNSQGNAYHSYFVASYKSLSRREAESVLLRARVYYNSQTFRNETDIEKLVSDGIGGTTWQIVCERKREGDICDASPLVSLTIGEVKLHSLGERSVEFIGLNPDIRFDKVYTYRGLQIQLPVEMTSTTTCAYNSGCVRLGVDREYDLYFTEEKINGVIGAGQEFYLDINMNSALLPHVAGINGFGTGGVNGLEVGTNTGIYETYIISPLATRILHNTFPEQDYAAITYHGKESYGGVFLSSEFNSCDICGRYDYTVFITFIDNDEVVLDINGERVPLSGKLRMGDRYRLSDNSQVRIYDISCLSVSGELCSTSFYIYSPHGFFREVFDLLEGETRTVTVSVPCGYQCAELPSGIVSWWPLDYSGIGQGNNIRDIIDSNDGIFYGGPALPQYQEGKVGNALDFDGVDDYVQVLDSNNLDVTSVTLDAWVKPFEHLTKKVIIAKGIGDISYGMEIFDDGQLACYFTSSLGTMFFGGSRSLPLGEWTFVSCTYNEHTGIAELLTNRGDHVVERGQPAPLITVTNDVYMGSIGPSFGNYKGLIDEVEIFNRALSEEEIRAIYQAGSIGKCRPTIPPAPICGNGVIEPPEQCDDGNRDPADQCSNQCTWTFCGDFIVQQPNGTPPPGTGFVEQCDGFGVYCGALFPGWNCGNTFAECNPPNTPNQCEYDISNCNCSPPPPPPIPVCGNNVCESGETCSNCESDCGRCRIDPFCRPGTICIE